MDETTAANQTTDPLYFDTAYDLVTMEGGFAGTTGTFEVRDPAGNIVDAVLYANMRSDVAGSTLSSGHAIAATGAWTPAGATGMYNETTFRSAAVQDIDNGANDRPGVSMQRTDDTDDNDKSDWADDRVSTWGANNVGQTDL